MSCNKSPEILMPRSHVATKMLTREMRLPPLNLRQRLSAAGVNMLFTIINRFLKIAFYAFKYL